MSRDRPRDMAMAEVVRLQEAACEIAGSNLYARILHEIADDLDRDGPCAAVLGPWSEDALHRAIPLRLLAAVHRIVLDGRAPDLARFFPSAGGSSTDDPAEAFVAAVVEHGEEIAVDMHRGVQTNEVGRACSLLGGFHAVARESGLPLRLLEVGASAGLLLRWDRYEYVGGGRTWGSPGGLRFDEPWTDQVPDFVDDLEIASRRGCDIEPIDLSSDSGVNTLRGFLWPDQIERRTRLDAAIEVARLHPAVIDRADAGDWVESQLADPVDGVATVIYHSIVLQYLPRSSFEHLRDTISQAGERAAPSAPIHWLRMEPAGEVADLRMQSWPGGDDVLLGTSGFHGPPVDWRAG